MKNKFLSSDERNVILAARKILKKVGRKNAKLESIRDWCDENKDKDKGGVKWKAATKELYDLLDETWKLGIRVEQNGEIELMDHRGENV